MNDVKAAVGKSYSAQFHLLKAASCDDVDVVKALIGTLFSCQFSPSHFPHSVGIC
jgi:hypothetical protein